MFAWFFCCLFAVVLGEFFGLLFWFLFCMYNEAIVFYFAFYSVCTQASLSDFQNWWNKLMLGWKPHQWVDGEENIPYYVYFYFKSV